MELLSNLLPAASQPDNEQTAESLRQLQDRMDLLRGEIMKAYLSARRELPEDKVLDVEVSLALSELKEIPSAAVEVCFQEAKVLAGAFMVTNGAVLKAWRERRKSSEGDAQKAIRDRNAETHRRALIAYEAEKPTEEFLAGVFAEARAKLGEKSA